MIHLTKKAWIGIGAVTATFGYLLWSAKKAGAAPIKTASPPTGKQAQYGTPAVTVQQGKTPTLIEGKDAAAEVVDASKTISGDIGKAAAFIEKGAADLGGAGDTSTSSTPSYTGPSTDELKRAYAAGYDIGQHAGSGDLALGGTDNMSPPSQSASGLSNDLLYQQFTVGYTAGYMNQRYPSSTSGIPRVAMGAYHPAMYGYPQGIYGRRYGWN